MARISPQQAQQMSQTLSGLTSSLQAMSRSLGQATPQQRSQISAALGNLGGVLGTARQVIGGGISAPAAPVAAATPAITPATVPATPTPTPDKTPEQEYQDKLRALVRHLEGRATEKPVEKGLSPEEKQTFATEKEQLRARYSEALEALGRQQEKERGRLLGRYAAMGFSEPGAIAGPMASEPGIVTKALQEIGEQQRREQAAYEQAQASGLLEITKAEQEAERRAKTEEAEKFEKRQEAMTRNLEDILKLYTPERFTLGGRLFERDVWTGAMKDVTPAEALEQKVEVERNGKLYQITYDAEGREIGAIELGPVKKEKETTPSLFQEWTLAGGKEGTGMTFPEWKKWSEEIKKSEVGSKLESKGLLPGEED
jgi:hypothetical protein